MGGETATEPTAIALPTKKQGILDAPARASKVAAKAKAAAAANKAVVTPAKAKPVAKVVTPAKVAKPAAADPHGSSRRTACRTRSWSRFETTTSSSFPCGRRAA